MSYNFSSLFNEFRAKALRFAKTQSVLATFVFSLGGSACNFLFTSKKIPLLKYGGIVTQVDIPGCGSQVMHLCPGVKDFVLFSQLAISERFQVFVGRSVLLTTKKLVCLLIN